MLCREPPARPAGEPGHALPDGLRGRRVRALLHNDLGDARAAVARVAEVLGPPVSTVRIQLTDMRAKFDAASAQGTRAYVDQLSLDHPEVDPAVAAAGPQLAVLTLFDALLDTSPA